MLQTSVLREPHKDLVTDVAYDFYGLRLATCSLDQKIKVWKVNDTSGEWDLENEWKGHEAPIVKLSWAHPEFGTLLASSSFDHTVKVWEEIPYEPRAGTQQHARWAERAWLIEARASVRAVEFAPPYFGLKLAALSSDSVLRIYECLEIYNLTSWQPTEEIDVQQLNTPSPTLAGIGTPTLTSTNLENVSGGASPSLTATINLSAGAATNVPTGKLGTAGKEADGGWCLAWCKDKWWGEIVAVGAGATSVLKIIKFSPSHQPSVILSLRHKSPRQAHQNFAITSVSWAPSCGRSYHLVATGSRDGYVRIWKLVPPPMEDSVWSAQNVAELGDHESSVGRVEWNITGTVLSSAGDDGRIRIWKSIGNAWRNVGSFTTYDGDAEDGEDGAVLNAED